MGTGSRSTLTAFPTPEEGLALQASLLEGDRAIAAWRALSKTAAAPAGAGIAWIAPLLMANLKRLVPGDPWVRDHPHFLTLCELKARAILESARNALRALEEASVPTMALKGLALGVSVYPSPGLRTVSDLDILVPGSDFPRAVEALGGKGHRGGPAAPRNQGDLRANHAQVLVPAKRHEPTLDLHWHVLASARADDDDAYFWNAALPIKVGTVATLSLRPEDQLLHVLVHGVRWTRMPHVRWVADAALLLRATRDAFDVDRFLEGAKRFDVVVPVQEGLGHVAELLGEGRELLERSLTLKRSRFSTRAFKARATAYEDRNVTDRIALRVESALWSHRARRAPRRRPLR
jgi:hypothetical protein